MSGRLLNVQRVGVKGHEISWAGECPWTGTYCFGTDDGGFFMPPDLVPDSSAGRIECVAGAINGIAFSGDRVAFSSPEEVALWARDIIDPPRLSRLAISFTGGAHGITVSSPGSFIATLGDDGLLFLGSGANQSVSTQVAQPASSSAYFYKLVPFISLPGNELFLCAARQDGLLLIRLDHGTPKITSVGYEFDGHDIIDVCPLKNQKHPHAVACLSHSGAIFIVPDVLSNVLPYEVRFSEIEGTGYSLIATQDHLFVLTDTQFVALPDVVSRVIEKVPLDKSMPPAPIMPISASDMFLVGEHVVLLVDGNAHFIEIAELVGRGATGKAQILGSKNLQVPTNVASHRLISTQVTCHNSVRDLAFVGAVSA